MAKVVATYDTETKELQLNIDGQDKGVVERVCFYSSAEDEEKYGYFEASFKNTKENGVRYHLSAHGSEIKQSDFLQDHLRNVLNKNKNSAY